MPPASKEVVRGRTGAAAGGSLGRGQELEFGSTMSLRIFKASIYEYSPPRAGCGRCVMSGGQRAADVKSPQQPVPRARGRGPRQSHDCHVVPVSTFHGAPLL